jgi:hypothetical protein
VVDTGRLAEAAQAAARRSRDVLDAAGTSRAPLARVAIDLSGAECATAAACLGRAVDRVLGELGGALDRLGRLLAVAAGDYGDAERRSVGSLARAPATGAAAGSGPARGAAS